ncbi:hypothetical protein [Jatrophihabitans sp.]|uniref:hypothetical protein n=1 Tax=Jatrophihabitans sp. TaxID=1932789 RepID=UPI0030C75939|nr:hypothetical protein [Jatrophihabitans sp.]
MKPRATKLLAAAAAVGLVATMSSVVGGQAAGAAPSSVPADTVLIATGTVTTADKHTWALEVIGSTGFVLVGIERTISTADTGYEAHSWQIPSKRSDFTFSTSSRKATLNLGTGGGSLATVDLAFAGKAPVKSTCSTGTDTTYPGTLTGKLILKTGLKNGGTIGSSSIKFKTANVISATGCDPGEPANTCVESVDFDAFPNSGTVDLFGETNPDNKSATISVSREVGLSSPKGASRSDEGGLMKGALPVFNATAKTLTVKTESSGALTGSAVLTGKKVGAETSSCKVGSKKYALTDTSYEGALTSPKAAPLTAHTTLTHHRDARGDEERRVRHHHSQVAA